MGRHIKYVNAVMKEGTTSDDHTKLWLDYLATGFKEEGDLEFFYAAQARVITEFDKGYMKRYGNRDRTTKQLWETERVDIGARLYYNILNGYDLIDRSVRFDRRWLSKHSTLTLAQEEAAVRGLNARNLKDCLPSSKILARAFFKDFHETFVPLLKGKEVYHEALREGRQAL